MAHGSFVLYYIYFTDNLSFVCKYFCRETGNDDKVCHKIDVYVTILVVSGVILIGGLIGFFFKHKKMEDIYRHHFSVKFYTLTFLKND